MPKQGSNPFLQWRIAQTFYYEGRDWPSGSWLASPGRYAVGHKVRPNAAPSRSVPD